MRALALTAALAAFALAGPALAQSGPKPAAPKSDKPAAAARPAPGDNSVVAVVNGEEIRFSELAQYHAALPPQYRQIPLPQIFDELVSAVVDRRIIIQAAKKANVEGDAEVKRRVAFAVENVLQEAYVNKILTDQLTDERLKDSYARMIKSVPPREEVHARHILVESEEAAKKLIADLDKGADFVTLAKEKSKGPSSGTGGDLGYFQREQMLPEFSQVAFALEKGTYSKTPVKTKYGWHVIKVEDKRSSPPPSFDESKDEIRAQESQVVVGEAIDSLRKGATIKRFNPDGSETKKN